MQGRRHPCYLRIGLAKVLMEPQRLSKPLIVMVLFREFSPRGTWCRTSDDSVDSRLLHMAPMRSKSWASPETPKVYPAPRQMAMCIARFLRMQASHHPPSSSPPSSIQQAARTLPARQTRGSPWSTISPSIMTRKPLSSLSAGHGALRTFSRT